MNPLPFGIFDADQHSIPPHDAYERYIDPSLREKAVRTVRGEDGSWKTLYAGALCGCRPKTSR